MEYIPLLLLGVFICAIGVCNLRGNLATIHWYHRRNVRPEDVPSYGKAMGAGTLIIGGALIVTAVLLLRLETESCFYLTAAGLAVGLGVMLWGQLKYNHGIF